MKPRYAALLARADEADRGLLSDAELASLARRFEWKPSMAKHLCAMLIRQTLLSGTRCPTNAGDLPRQWVHMLSRHDVLSELIGGHHHPAIVSFVRAQLSLSEIQVRSDAAMSDCLRPEHLMEARIVSSGRSLAILVDAGASIARHCGQAGNTRSVSAVTAAFADCSPRCAAAHWLARLADGHVDPLPTPIADADRTWLAEQAAIHADTFGMRVLAAISASAA